MGRKRKGKKPPKFMPLSGAEELRDVNEAIRIAHVMVKVYEERGMPSWRDAKVSEQQAVIAKAQAEIATITSQFLSARTDREEQLARIKRLETRRRTLEKRSVVKKLLKLAEEARKLREELGRDGQPLSE